MEYILFKHIFAVVDSQSLDSYYIQLSSSKK